MHSLCVSTATCCLLVDSRYYLVACLLSGVFVCAVACVPWNRSCCAPQCEAHSGGSGGAGGGSDGDVKFSSDDVERICARFAASVLGNFSLHTLQLPFPLEVAKQQEEQEAAEGKEQQQQPQQAGVAVVAATETQPRRQLAISSSSLSSPAQRLLLQRCLQRNEELRGTMAALQRLCLVKSLHPRLGLLSGGGSATDVRVLISGTQSSSSSAAVRLNSNADSAAEAREEGRDSGKQNGEEEDLVRRPKSGAVRSKTGAMYRLLPVDLLQVIGNDLLLLSLGLPIGAREKEKRLRGFFSFSFFVAGTHVCVFVVLPLCVWFVPSLSW